MQLVTIEGGRIEEVWFRAIKACVDLGHDYVIDKGEYEGQKRKEFDMVILRIKTPWIRPLACQSQYITPTSDDEIMKYFHNYLMNPEFESKEEEKNNEYKYATWIAPNWQHCCDLLTKGMGGCNQATISLGSMMEQDFFLHSYMKDRDDYVVEKRPGFDPPRAKIYTHPPCLRVISLKIRYGKLHIFVYFRSWDIGSGMPTNLGGIELFKEHCLDYINMHLEERGSPILENGEIIAISPGAHLYDHMWGICEEYVGSKSPTVDIPGVTVIG